MSTDPHSLTRDGFCGERFDALVSCMASRTGAPKDAWAIDYQAHANALAAAQKAGVTQVVLLSAICVQKPVLAFQYAKLAFEKALIDSGLIYSIVRATAFFKSLSGQVERVKRGKPFLVFGDGTLTACKPISDDDLADYLAECLEARAVATAILPIGGPGEAITPAPAGRASVCAARARASISTRAARAARRRRRRARRVGTSDPCCSRKRRSSPASGATTPPNPCSSSIRKAVDTMRPPPRRPAPRRYSTITRVSWTAPPRWSAAITRYSEISETIARPYAG